VGAGENDAHVHAAFGHGREPAVGPAEHDHARVSTRAAARVGDVKGEANASAEPCLSLDTCGAGNQGANAIRANHDGWLDPLVTGRTTDGDGRATAIELDGDCARARPDVDPGRAGHREQVSVESGSVEAHRWVSGKAVVAVRQAEPGATGRFDAHRRNRPRELGQRLFVDAEIPKTRHRGG
jgi:hypothetical protein